LFAVVALGCSLGDGSQKNACAADPDCNPGRYCGSAGVCVPGVEAAALGFKHTCVRRQTGAVQCWGDNAGGQAGGTAPQVLLPLTPGTRLPELLAAPASFIDVGELFGCALMTSGKVTCWGDNGVGQLGQGPGATSPGAADLGTGYEASALGVGQRSACAILSGGRVKCWGGNENAQLGLGDKVNRGDAPNQMGDNLPAVSLGTGRTARAIAVGDAHVCVILDGDDVSCFGDNHWGQLGLENTVTHGDDLNPLGATVLVAPMGSVGRPVALAAAGDHTCALFDVGRIKCWGANTNGELGIGVAEMSWGDQPGEMGDNLPFVDLGAGRSVVAVAAGEGHTCAILDGGALKCWGQNDFGQLGLDSTTNKGLSPSDMGDHLPVVDLGSGRRALAVAAGAHHTCAVLDNHALKCWGLNTDGELGLADLTDNRGDGYRGNVSAVEMGDNLPFVDLGE
jgi:alpha-tubulin suppressor-like RCC1 family protein